MTKGKKKVGSGGPVSDINVTPMVDVMLVILIIFMVITPLITKGVSVELYKANNPIAMEKADQEDATVIAITRDGRPYLGSSVVQKEDIPAKVKAMMEGKLETTVYIKCDNRTRFNALTDVIDSLRSAGIDQLGLLTDRLKENKPAAEGGMH